MVIPVVLDDVPLWVSAVDKAVAQNAEAECRSELLFSFEEKIPFLAIENAGAPLWHDVRLFTRLFVAEVDVDSGATASLILQLSIDFPKMIEDSSPEKLCSFLLVLAACSPVRLLKDCLVERGGSIGGDGKDPGCLQRHVMAESRTKNVALRFRWHIFD